MKLNNNSYFWRFLRGDSIFIDIVLHRIKQKNICQKTVWDDNFLHNVPD